MAVKVPTDEIKQKTIKVKEADWYQIKILAMRSHMGINDFLAALFEEIIKATESETSKDQNVQSTISQHFSDRASNSIIHSPLGEANYDNNNNSMSPTDPKNPFSYPSEVLELLESEN